MIVDEETDELVDLLDELGYSYLIDMPEAGNQTVISPVAQFPRAGPTPGWSPSIKSYGIILRMADE